MLKELRIERFAIIEELVLPLEKGLLAVTGETGAGKSILFNALTLLLGRRARTEMIRKGAEQALVSAVFMLSQEQRDRLFPLLNEFGCPCDEELHIRRIVTATGRNRVFINGEMSSLKVLTLISQDLIEVVGQHASHGLLDPLSHLQLLDEFASTETEALDFSNGVLAWRRDALALRRLEEARDESQQRSIRLQQDLDEILLSDLKEDEEDRLRLRLNQIQAAEEITQKSNQAAAALQSQPGSAVDVLGLALRAVGDISHFNSELERIYGVLTSAQIELEEASRDLRHIGENADWSEDDLTRLQERLFVYTDLKNRYGGEIASVQDAALSMTRELESIALDDAAITRLSESVEADSKRLKMKAVDLRRRRKAAAAQLEIAVEKELCELGMPRCRFRVSFEPLDAVLSENGLDRITFLIAPNPGEGMKPLAKIASGGELSRVLLALKVALIGLRSHSVYLFDEVDAGIGGGIAEVVGRKLQAVGSNSQALCITHLAQVASCAHHHYVVSKSVDSGRTISKMKVLDPPDRIREISRMIGASELTEGSRLHAIEMLERNRPVAL